MKILLNYAFFFGGLFLTTTTHAQALAADLNQPRVKSIASTTLNTPPTSTTLEQARKQLMQLFNLYRDYSVTIDTQSFKGVFVKENDIPAETAFTQETITQVAFATYLEKMKTTIQKRLAKLKPEEGAERSRAEELRGEEWRPVRVYAGRAGTKRCLRDDRARTRSSVHDCLPTAKPGA